MRNLIIRFIQVVVLAVSAQAQTSSSAVSPTMEQANQAYSAKNWSSAANAFEVITRAQPENALAWLRLGVSRHKLGQFAEAVDAYKHAENDPQVGASAWYREAASLARMNKNREAIVALDKAVDAGLAQPALFQQDADLAALGEETAFKEVIPKADTVAHPCAHLPEYR